jgi:alpha-1,2-mannosyltransferase
VAVVGAVSFLFLVYHLIKVRSHGMGTVGGDDFHFYWEAGRRFMADPRSLYLDPAKSDLRGFLYPPPSIALFLPFAALPQMVAGAIFRGISLVAVVMSVDLLARLFESTGLTVRAGDRGMLVVIALAIGPTFINMLYGQVNTLILLDCLAFRWLLGRRRHLLAGAVLALGVWLKVYPVLCLIWVLAWERERHDWRRMLLGFGSAFAAVPLLCLPWVPSSLYRVYVSGTLPMTMGRTFQHILDQSLLAAAARTAGPVASYADWRNCDYSVSPPAWGRVVNTCLILGSFVGFGLWSRSAEPARRLAGFFCILAAIPVVSPLGWSYVYVLALPALFLALSRAPRGPFARSALLVACAALLLPATRELKALRHAPELVGHLFYDRYLFATMLVLGLVVWSERKRGTPSPAGVTGHRALGEGASATRAKLAMVA